MNVQRNTDPRDREQAIGTGVGEKLYHFISRYGAETTKAIIAEVRNSVLSHARDDGTCVRIEIEDNEIENMYRDHVFSGKDPVITFLEYRSLIEVIIDLNSD